MTRILDRIPHLIGSERWVSVPAANGIIAHKSMVARAACGEDCPATLCTRRSDLVRCPDCRATLRLEEST